MIPIYQNNNFTTADVLGPAIVSGVLFGIFGLLLWAWKSLSRKLKLNKLKPIAKFSFGKELECVVNKNDVIFLYDGSSEYLRIPKNKINGIKIYKNLLLRKDEKIVTLRIEWKNPEGNVENRDLEIIDDEQLTLANQVITNFQKYIDV